MGLEKVAIYRIILAVVIIACLVLIFFQNTSAITGHATSGTTKSNVSIQYFMSIDLSTNLQEGILFGSVATLPAVDVNASHNYDGGSSATTLYVNTSLDGNTAVDLCTKANSGMTTSTGVVLGLGNETYLNATSTDADIPGPSGDAVALTTTYAKSGEAVAVGNATFFRFWLDVPAAQAGGDYNNSVLFKTVRTADPGGCGS